jgi:hypothetical protein
VGETTTDQEREAHRDAVVAEAAKLIARSGGPSSIGKESPLRALADEVGALHEYDSRHPRVVSR